MTTPAQARQEMSAMLERHLKKAEQIEREGPEAVAAAMLAEEGGYFTPEFHREYAVGHYRGWIEVLDGLVAVVSLADEGHDYGAHEEHPPEDGRIMECPLCAALAALEDSNTYSKG